MFRRFIQHNKQENSKQIAYCIYEKNKVQKFMFLKLFLKKQIIKRILHEFVRHGKCMYSKWINSILVKTNLFLK